MIWGISEDGQRDVGEMWPKTSCFVARHAHVMELLGTTWLATLNWLIVGNRQLNITAEAKSTDVLRQLDAAKGGVDIVDDVWLPPSSLLGIVSFRCVGVYHHMHHVAPDVQDLIVMPTLIPSS